MPSVYQLGCSTHADLFGPPLKAPTPSIAHSQVLPQFNAPHPREALTRMGLVLAASLLLVVVVSTIDGLLLQLYILGSRRFA